MKKIVLLLLVIIPTIAFCAEPKIEFDKIDSDGSRMIGCNTIYIGKWTDKINVNLSISCIQIKDNPNYQLSMRIFSYAPISIKKGGVLLLRFGNDSIAELNTSIEYSDEIGKYDSYTKLRQFIIYPAYDISEELIKTIAKYGIKKIRIETNLENIDRELNNKKTKETAKFLGSQYALIQEALENNGNNIMEGF